MGSPLCSQSLRTRRISASYGWTIPRTCLKIVAIVLLFGACDVDRGEAPAEATALANPFEQYLAEPDPSYRYEAVQIIEGDGHTIHVLRVTSQRWLTEDLVDEPAWWHWLTIVVPDEVRHAPALLWIGGGSRNTGEPTAADPLLIHTAAVAGTVAASVHNVPFQPLAFGGDGAPSRYEDDLIAYGWRTFLEGGARDEDAVWLARQPMTKAAIRAMDTVTEYLHDHAGLTVDRYVVSGASKRGWTAWTAGIFDERVIAIAPVVIDLLNLVPSFEHHWRAYGHWSPAIRDYEEARIMDWQYTPEFRRLVELVDPYSYLDRLTLPKFIVNAAGDEFFLPDSWQFYWDELPGEKALRYVPNTGHSMSGTDAMESLVAFHARVATDSPLPRFDWSVEDGAIRVEIDPADPPETMLLWQAENPDGRDFRLPVIGRTWSSRPLTPSADGRVLVSLDAPEAGYRAFFVEGTFTEGGPLKLTTGVVVTPDTYPFPPFQPGEPRRAP